MAVLVVGMHRSGTSAMAGALEALGLTVGDRHGLMKADPRNPVGYYELQSVADLNDEILSHLGGSWDCPPEVPVGWLADQSLGDLVVRASELIRSSFGTPRFVLKDPRLSVLLPLWRRALLDRCCAVMIVRDPQEVAWSLVLRDGIPVHTGLALWFAYYHAALVGLEGLPVFICRYEALVTKTTSVMEAVVQSLQFWEELPRELDFSAATSRVEPRLRRDTRPRSQTDFSDLPKDVIDLDKLLGEYLGQHDRFESGPLPVPSWERSLLEERRRAWLISQRHQEDAGRLRQALAATEARLADNGRRLLESDQRLREITSMFDSASTATEHMRLELLALRERWNRLERRLPVRAFRAMQRARYGGPHPRTA